MACVVHLELENGSFIRNRIYYSFFIHNDDTCINIFSLTNSRLCHMTGTSRRDRRGQKGIGPLAQREYM